MFEIYFGGILINMFGFTFGISNHRTVIFQLISPRYVIRIQRITDE